MNELRWILLVAGLLLIAGIYAFGVRARRRAAAPEHERVTRVEPARTVAVVPETPLMDPEEEEAASEEPSEPPEYAVEPARRPEHAPLRREPRLEPRFDGDADDELEPATIRLEPRVEAQAPPRAEPRAEQRVEPRITVDVDERRAAPAPESTRKPASQKIVAVRVVASAGAQFAGAQLLAALQADGFAFGRYQIFHRLDEAGRPVVSLASLKEPGTFDPEAMPDAQYRGIALFTVMPGPLAPVRAFDELIVTARALAATLGGQLQDERGSPLSLARIGHLREEVAEFERARGAAPDR
jgi:cell division protein ZipA